jgi:hypothetical protein
MTNGTITRRELLALLAAGAALLAGVPAADAVALRAPTAPDELTAWLDATLGGADLSAVAAAWRERHPAESTADALARYVLAGRRRGEPLASFLARAVASEHAAGRAELLDGWFLAPTEARLAALLSLTA